MQKEGNSMYRDFSKRTKLLDQLIAKKVSQVFEQSGAEPISYSSFSVLEYLFLHQTTNVFQKDIERALNVNRATASKMIALLVKKGYVAQKSYIKDGRYKLISLTFQGQQLYQQDVQSATKLDTFFNQILSPEDFVAFDQIYGKLVKALSN